MAVTSQCGLGLFGQVLADSAQHPDQKQDEQNRSHSNAAAARVTPTPVAVIAASAAQEQQQDNQKNQHSAFALFLNDLFNLGDFFLDGPGITLVLTLNFE